jgi:hypothetical protein
VALSIEQWIRRRSTAAVDAGLGEWADASELTELGKPIYRMDDGPVRLMLSELGFAYDGAPAAFECRYDQVEVLHLAPLRDLLPKNHDLLPRNGQSRLLILGITRKGDLQRLEMQFSLRAYNQVVSALSHIVDGLK